MELTTTYPDTSDTDTSVIDEYPSEDIMLFLYHVQNGETENALAALQTIMNYISKEIDTILVQQYMCYNILNAYINCLKQMKYPLNKKEVIDLLTYNDVNELYNSLSTSVMWICESVKNNYVSLPKKIIEYVNKNFANADICRTQVADYFGISVYTLSRLFKDYVGIGFKEYITAKRLELSRSLLLTTDKSITEISSEVGFNAPDYFSKIFKLNYGVSPSEFRNA